MESFGPASGLEFNAEPASVISAGHVRPRKRLTSMKYYGLLGGTAGKTAVNKQ